MVSWTAEPTPTCKSSCGLTCRHSIDACEKVAPVLYGSATSRELVAVDRNRHLMNMNAYGTGWVVRQQRLEQAATLDCHWLLLCLAHITQGCASRQSPCESQGCRTKIPNQLDEPSTLVWLSVGHHC